MYVRPLPLKRSASQIPERASWWVGLFYLLFASVIGALLAVTTQAAPLWTHKPTADIKWYRVTDVGSILIGSKSGLYTLDGQNGQTIWTRNDLTGTEEFEVETIVGTPLLLVSDTSGTFSKGTKLIALDLLTGQNIWETDKLKGATVAVEPVYEKDLVLLVTVPDNRANKAKPRISALRLTTGELVWEADYPDSVDLYGIERGSKFFRSSISPARTNHCTTAIRSTSLMPDFTAMSLKTASSCGA